ncbi:MAG: Lrp/AsnC family transcriptional regulator [Lentisphaerae bacterium]|nr:Lrp/AsnC family transcriptional regulator [Lentisphaerota bacterium]
MDRLLELMKANARLPLEALAQQLGETPASVAARIADYEARGVIRGYQAVINTELVDDDSVRAVIELRIRPAQDGGFDRIANRVSRFDQVESMFLMSGGFDLLLFVKGRNLQEVARFVSSKLANMEGVLSTSTHFMLKTYKDQGVLLEQQDRDERLQVVP